MVQYKNLVINNSRAALPAGYNSRTAPPDGNNSKAVPPTGLSTSSATGMINTMTYLLDNISYQANRNTTDQRERWKLLEHSLKSIEETCTVINKTYEQLNIEGYFNVCDRFNLESKRPRPIIKCPYSHLNKYRNASISLVVSLTPSRFSVFETVMEFWNGPISVSVYLDCKSDFKKVFANMQTWLSHDALDIHVVLGHGVSIKYYKAPKLCIFMTDLGVPCYSVSNVKNGINVSIYIGPKQDGMPH